VCLASGGVIHGYLPDQTLRIWDLASGTERYVLKGHTGAVHACAWSPSGLELVSGSEDATPRIWDATSGKGRHVLQGHTGPVHACAWSPDGAWIFSASDDRTLRIWDGQTGHSIMTMLVVGRPTCLAPHPSMPLLAAGDAGGTVYLLDLIGIEYGPIISYCCRFGGRSWHPVPCLPKAVSR
jgi:WD40 repeat protein